jgi:membrane-bound lytic murein transglycosylase A
MEALPARLVPASYDRLSGWDADDHAAAFQAFRRGAAAVEESPPKKRGLGIDADGLLVAVQKAGALPDRVSSGEARAFFEANFEPLDVAPASGPGFFTGYYEPVVEGSRSPTADFTVPLYAVPDDLCEFDPAEPPPGIDAAFRFARRTPSGLVAHPDRGEIEAGYLRGRGLELAYLADPVDAFFIHVQGAARIRLAEGDTMRVTFAAKTGHPYTPIGAVLIALGALEKGEATMQAIRAWLHAHPAEAPGIMAKNRSFIFFREAPVSDRDLGPVAAAKVPLTAGRSLAVDRLLHSFHMPVWVETVLPDGSPFRRLMIAQDTGSAIVGPARGDIFFGSGDAAGALAGGMKAPGRFVVLAPRRAALP